MQTARDSEVAAIIKALNKVTGGKQANLASVIVACTQILGHTVMLAEPSTKAEIRTGILALIDGFAMQAAIEEEVP
jgi:hypothetical protein